MTLNDPTDQGQQPSHKPGSGTHHYLKGVVDSSASVKDSWGAQIVDDLSPGPDDIGVEGKRGLDTFASTNLDFILRSK
ncbi:MAG: cysteine hydrolase, partial [Actinomycetota bacterium]|nr:cysteine hydrolase [Actinomycetota bacterium]